MKAKPDETNIKTKTNLQIMKKILETLLQKFGKKMMKSTLLLLVQTY